MKIFILGHNEDSLKKIPELEFLEKTDLSKLNLPVPNTNDIAENRFYLQDPETFSNCPEYIGTLTHNFNDKYHDLIGLENLESIKNLLKPDTVLAAAPTHDFFKNHWLKWTYSYHQTIEPYMKDLSNIMGIPLTNEDTLWANNFVCHKTVFIDFVNNFRKTFQEMHKKHGYDFKIKVDDPSRTAAYIYERVAMLYFSNRKDLKIKRIPLLMDSVLFGSSAADNYRTLTQSWKTSLQEAGVQKQNIMHISYQIPRGYKPEIKFKSDTYNYCIKMKLENMLKVFKTVQSGNSHHRYIFWSDCDVQFFPNRLQEWKKLIRFMEEKDRDIYYPHEYSENDTPLLNAGVLMYKKSKSDIVVDFYEMIHKRWNEILEEYDGRLPEMIARYPFFDQSLIREEKHKINYELIPQRWQIHARERQEEYRKTILFHHAVDTITLYDKIEKMEKVRNWTLS